MSEWHDRARIAHEEQEYKERDTRIRSLVKPSTHGNPYGLTIAHRFAAAYDYLERHDYTNAIAQVDKIVVMNPTFDQRRSSSESRCGMREE